MGPMTQKNAEGFDYRMNQLLVVNVNMTEVFEDWWILLQTLSLQYISDQIFPNFIF